MGQGNGLENKRVVVLGGSSGIGLAVAELALSHGAEVVIASRNEARVKKAAETLRGKISGEACDAGDEQAIEGLFKKLGV